MQQNWLLTGGIIAVLAIPFGLALFEDSTKSKAEADEPPDIDYLDAVETEYEYGDDILADEPKLGAWERVEVADNSAVLPLIGPSAGELSTDLRIALSKANSGDSDSLDVIIAGFNSKHDSAALGYERHNRQLAIRPPDYDQLVETLASRWGPPSHATAIKKAWLDASGNRRAIADEDVGTVAFEPVASLSELVAELDGCRSLSKVKRDFHADQIDEYDDVTYLSLPSHELGLGGGVMAELLLEGDQVVEISAAIDFALEPARAEDVELPAPWSAERDGVVVRVSRSF